MLTGINILKQKMMRKVVLSLIPILVLSCYLFGLRVLILLFVVNFFAVITEYWVIKSIDKEKAKISEAVFVTGFLFTLTLPPQTPYWVAAVGIVFGMLFGKMAFGGFGKNIFNPALVGRCFIYISFPSFMTAGWLEPYNGLPGGFSKYAADTLAGATPLVSRSESYLRLLLGTVSGSLGETSALLIVLAGIYLVVTKTASYRIILSSLFGFLALDAILYFTGVASAGPIYSLLSGGVLFGIIFMATDPVSAPKLENSKLIYGFLIGAIAVVIRTFSLFTEGIMFAILIANTFASLIDMKLKVLSAGKKAKA